MKLLGAWDVRHGPTETFKIVPQEEPEKEVIELFK
jgi:hypothetical protein